MALGAFKTVYLLFALATVPQALAGPGCARRNYGKPDCVEKCKHGWGVSGHYMGRNKWGSVMNNTDTDSSDLESIVAVACGLNQTAVADPDATSSDLPCSSSLPSADGYEPTPTPSPAEPSSPEPSPPSSSSSSPPTEPSSPPVPSPSPPGESSPPPAPPSSSSSPVPSSPAPPSPSPTSTPGLTPSPVPSPSPSPSPSPPASSPSSSTPTVQSDTSTLENDALTAHNSFRALHGASPLAWSDDLASAATKWVSRCVFEHSQGQVGDYGENLYAASGTSNSITDAVNAWTSEASQYDPNNPQFSHFTQVVWKSTTQVGCAIFTCPAGSIFDASYGASQFIACEYNPPGNVIGEFADNVQA